MLLPYTNNLCVICERTHEESATYSRYKRYEKKKNKKLYKAHLVCQKKRRVRWKRKKTHNKH